MAEASGGAPRFSRSVKVEQKTFIVEHKGATIRITEQRERYQTFALFPLSLGDWICSTLESAAEKNDGHLGKKGSGDLNIFASKKKNEKGPFISLMFMSPRIKSGVKFIVCPAGAEGIGWLNVAESIRAVCTQATSEVGEETQPREQPLEHGSQPPEPHRRQARRGQRPRRAPRRERQESASLRVRVTQGNCIMSHLPKMIDSLFKLTSVPSISITSDPQVFKLLFSSKADATRLGEIATLQTKSCAMEFMDDIVTAQDPGRDVAWTDITRRVVTLWGFPVSARTPDNIASFTTDFGAFRSMEVINPEEGEDAGIRVALEHSDLSLMPQLKYFGWDDDIHGIRIVPSREKRRRKKVRQNRAPEELPESSNAAERSEGMRKELGQGSRMRDKEPAGQNGQLLLLQNSANGQTHIPTPSDNTCAQALPSVTTPPPTINAVSTNSTPIQHRMLTPGASFAQVVMGSSLIGGRQESSSTPIADLNQPPVASPPHSQLEETIEGLIKVGDILGYDEKEKQLMVQNTIANLSKKCVKIPKESGSKALHG